MPRFGLTSARTSGCAAACLRALAAAGVLSAEESDQIDQGLQAVGQEFESNAFSFLESDEDIHTAVERRLGELIGPLAGKLHTGRSRNDQVATDTRLWLLETLPGLDQAIAGLQRALLHRAEADMDALMPGYTHLQRAQPVLLSHWWLSHFWPLGRDRDRLRDLAGRTAVLPLGAGALAGVPFPVDRFALARELGFARPAPNSLDAVSDRDFRVHLLYGTDRRTSQPAGRILSLESLLRAFRQLHHRLQPDAAEKEPRCLRTGARQDRGHDRLALRHAGDPQGAAFCL
jgi:argininosuccinate lyase